MLTANDRRPQEGRFQARPMARYEADGEGGKRQEMREAQNVEIGLVDRIHPIGEPAGHESIERFKMPGQRNQEGEHQISNRQDEHDARSQNNAELLRSAERAPGAEDKQQLPGIRIEKPDAVRISGQIPAEPPGKSVNQRRAAQSDI